MAEVNVTVPGLDEVEALLAEHDKLCGALRQNINAMRYAMSAIEVKMNQPPAATDG